MTQMLSPWPDDFDHDLDDEPRVPLTLSPAQRAALAFAVDRALRAEGCDNTLRAARRWAEATGVPSWARLRRELQGNGGHCDCELLFNVFPDADPPPVEPL